jgi:putative flippase GtrA
MLQKGPGRFLRFAGLSGCGWLFDLGLLAVLVRLARIDPAGANMISSLTAASLVFLVSRRRVFAGATGSAATRLCLYLCYTLAQVAVASICVGALARLFGGEFRRLGLSEAAVLAALAAKVLVTPGQLILNFLVAGRLNRRAPANPEAAHA